MLMAQACWHFPLIAAAWNGCGQLINGRVDPSEEEDEIRDINVVVMIQRLTTVNSSQFAQHQC